MKKLFFRLIVMHHRSTVNAIEKLIITNLLLIVLIYEKKDRLFTSIAKFNDAHSCNYVGKLFKYVYDLNAFYFIFTQSISHFVAEVMYD